MVLRQCFETMRENQANGTNKVDRKPEFSLFDQRFSFVFEFLDDSLSRIQVDVVLQKLFRWWRKNSNDSLCQSTRRQLRWTSSASRQIDFLFWLRQRGIFVLAHTQVRRTDQRCDHTERIASTSAATTRPSTSTEKYPNHSRTGKSTTRSASYFHWVQVRLSSKATQQRTSSRHF